MIMGWLFFGGGFLPSEAGNHLPYLLGDGEGLEDEAFGELGEVLLGEREDEVVALSLPQSMVWLQERLIVLFQMRKLHVAFLSKNLSSQIDREDLQLLSS